MSSTEVSRVLDQPLAGQPAQALPEPEPYGYRPGEYAIDAGGGAGSVCVLAALIVVFGVLVAGLVATHLWLLP